VWGSLEINTKFQSKSLKEDDYLPDLGVEGRTAHYYNLNERNRE
jgi:hypothetical protein